MCLNTVRGAPYHKRGKGYKIFWEWDYRIMSEFRWNEGGDYEIGKWNYAIQEPINSHCHGVYTSGFHVFTRKKDAINWKNPRCPRCVIYRIEYRDARVMGIQWPDMKVVVASQMKIIERVNT